MSTLKLEVPDAPRLLIEASLQPLQGTRFQPTGFPDIGAARYKLPDETEMLLVESAQSVANHLEKVCWDEATDELVPCLKGLPYVRVMQDGKSLTNSILEAHRLNSVYIEKSDGFDAIKAEVGEDGRFDRRRLARALLKRDPNSLVHGAFLESINGVQRLPRMVSGFVEARKVGVVASGGVKNDRVSAKGDGGGAAEGHGNVPFHRDEFSAESLTAFFNIDLSQLRSYGLGEDAERLIFGLAVWKILAFLESGLRLRTACDLDLVACRVTRPDGYPLPDRGGIEAALPGLIAAVTRSGAFAEPAVTVVNYGSEVKVAKPKRGKGGDK